MVCAQFTVLQVAPVYIYCMAQVL